MNLEEAKIVIKALQEDGVNEEAMEIMLSEITVLSYQQKKAKAGCGIMDSLEKCEECGEETFVWKMSGGGECTNPECNNVEICY
jgi:hypothetical protein